MMGGKTKMALS